MRPFQDALATTSGGTVNDFSSFTQAILIDRNGRPTVQGRSPHDSASCSQVAMSRMISAWVQTPVRLAGAVVPCQRLRHRLLHFRRVRWVEHAIRSARIVRASDCDEAELQHLQDAFRCDLKVGRFEVAARRRRPAAAHTPSPPVLRLPFSTGARNPHNPSHLRLHENYMSHSHFA